MNTASLGTTRDRSNARLALTFLFGAMIVAVVVAMTGVASDDVLRGPTRFIVMLVLASAFCGSAGLLGRIARSQESDQRQIWRISFATCFVTAAAFLVAFGPKGGIAPALLAFVAVAFTIAGIRSKRTSR